MSPRLRNVWQVEHEGTVKTCCNQDLFHFVATEEPQQDEENSRKQIMFHQNKDALFAELRSNSPCMPFSDESSKQLIHTQGNVAGLEFVPPEEARRLKKEW